VSVFWVLLKTKVVSDLKDEDLKYFLEHKMLCACRVTIFLGRKRKKAVSDIGYF
jgi:hypothetical protein